MTWSSVWSGAGQSRTLRHKPRTHRRRLGRDRANHEETHLIHTPVRRDDSVVVTHSVAGASSQLHVLGLAHHNAPALHLVSHRDEDVASEHVLDFSLLVLRRMKNTHNVQGIYLSSTCCKYCSHWIIIS